MQAKRGDRGRLEQEALPEECKRSVSTWRSRRTPAAEPKDVRIEQMPLVLDFGYFFDATLLAAVAEVECDHYVAPKFN